MHLWIIHTTILDWILRKNASRKQRKWPHNLHQKFMYNKSFVYSLHSLSFQCKLFWQNKGDFLCVKVDRYTKSKKVCAVPFFFFCNASSKWWKSPYASSAADFKCWELGENELITVVRLFWLILVKKWLLKGQCYRNVSFLGTLILCYSSSVYSQTTL